jgi:membrane protein
VLSALGVALGVAAGQAMRSRRPASLAPDDPQTPDPTTAALPATLDHTSDPAQESRTSRWRRLLKGTWAESTSDNMPMFAGGVAFFGFLALFPAAIATLLVWGLVVTPEEATQQIERLTRGLPDEATAVVSGQLTSVAGAEHGVGLGLVIAVLLALWSASGGVGNLIKAVNHAYDEEESRGVVKRRLLALGMTLGAIVFLFLAVLLLTVVPPTIRSLGLGTAGELLAQSVRWVLLVGLMLGGLAVVYRFAPNRDHARWQWATPGALVATALWVLGSVAFSVYVSEFGSYQKTYGALAGAAVLMLWLFLTAYVVLLGAELNAVAERDGVPG